MKISEKILLGILFAIVFFCIFSISYYALRTSNDEFWHIKTGEYIVQHHFHLPQKDIFTYTASDMDWVNHEWLSQVLFYWVYSAGGFPGFVLFKSIMIMIAFGCVYGVVYQRCRNHYISLFVTLLAALSSRHTLYPRPFIFSYILVPVYLYFLYELTEKSVKKYHYFIFPILMILWANLHGGAILGIILLVFFLAAQVARYIWTKQLPYSLKALAIILALTLLASLCNPYGWKVFELTFRVMNDKLLVASIGELHPPEFLRTSYYDAMLIITFVVVLATIRKLEIPDLLLLLFFGEQSLRHVRNLPLFAITAAAILAKHLSLSFDCFSKPKEIKDMTTESPSWIKAGSVILILYLALDILVFQHQLDLNKEMFYGPGLRINNYPVYASNFILQNDFSGNMFNEINSAGYLMFRLYPKHKVFTDNRFDLLGSKFLPDFYQIVEVGPRWQETLDKYQINFIITEQGSKLRKALDLSPDWVMVYIDRSYAIFVKNTPQNAALIARCQNSSNESNYF